MLRSHHRDIPIPILLSTTNHTFGWKPDDGHIRPKHVVTSSLIKYLLFKILLCMSMLPKFSLCPASISTERLFCSQVKFCFLRISSFFKKCVTHSGVQHAGLSHSLTSWRLDKIHFSTNLFIFMQFPLTTDTVKRPDQKCNQAQQEGCFKEWLHRNTSRSATCVLRGAYLRANVST